MRLLVSSWRMSLMLLVLGLAGNRIEIFCMNTA